MLRERVVKTESNATHLQEPVQRHPIVNQVSHGQGGPGWVQVSSSHSEVNNCNFLGSVLVRCCLQHRQIRAHSQGND
jgi:hypothetical protein